MTNAQDVILIADDEESAVNFASRLLEKKGFSILAAADGLEALRLAREKIPDLILLDVSMPGMSGYAVCLELRTDFRTRHIPVIFLSSKGTVPEKIQGLKLGADDYLAKPCDPEELIARVESALLRHGRNLGTNPLTKLPGNQLIEEEVNERIKNQERFAFAYLDIDHFKSYNDLYGFKKGDEIIQFVASILVDNLQGKGDRFFVGHIGGDDFVFIAPPPAMDGIADAVANSFDRAAPGFYTEEDRARGFVTSKNRQGQVVQTPLMTLSIALVNNEKRPLAHFGKVVEIACEMKRYAKSLPGRKGSWVVKDKRRD